MHGSNYFQQAQSSFAWCQILRQHKCHRRSIMRAQHNVDQSYAMQLELKHTHCCIVPVKRILSQAVIPLSQAVSQASIRASQAVSLASNQASRRRDGASPI